MDLFLDLDGVLADFDAHYEALSGIRPDRARDNVDWRMVDAAGDFYLHIPPMADMEQLWSGTARWRPTILTGVPSSVPAAAAHKRAWVRRHLGAHVPIVCCRSREKCLYCRPGAVLVDDWDKYRHLWLAAGGAFILHTSAADSLRQLEALDASGPGAE